MTLATTLNDNGADLGDHETAPILYSFANNLYVSWHNIFKAAIKEAIPGFKKIEGTDNWQPTEITRSTGLFKAVFGEGGFGTLRFQIVSKDANDNVTDYNIVTDKNATNFETAIDTEVTYNDKCADKAWNDWNNAGKPANGDIKDAFKAAVTGADITIYQRSNDNKFGWGYYCYYYYWNRHNDNRNNGVMGPMEFAVVRNNVYKIAVTKLSRLGHPRISENDPENPTPDTDDEVNNVYITVETETLPWVVRINNIEF
ncbi:MAG: Mfa1 fimbrilin C-terminal domain-containing protein [Duncaniella freteri]|nr:Mfa1 fimbrilin C-terminal domain-containing protein [Duncaniella freteri]